MAREIERKFLVADPSWHEGVEARHRIRQAYLATGGQASVRIRVWGRETAALTVKGAAAGIERDEFEYAIPVDDAEAMLALRQGRLVEKVRHDVRHGGHLWEIDVFAGDNEGLEVAEIELDAAGEAFERPSWLGEEVTGDPRYSNAALSARPFRTW